MVKPRNNILNREQPSNTTAEGTVVVNSTDAAASTTTTIIMSYNGHNGPLISPSVSQGHPVTPRHPRLVLMGSICVLS